MTLLPISHFFSGTGGLSKPKHVSATGKDKETYTDLKGHCPFQMRAICMLRDIDEKGWAAVHLEYTDSVQKVHTLSEVAMKLHTSAGSLQGPCTDYLSAKCNRLLQTIKAWIAAEEEIVLLMDEGMEVFEGRLLLGQLHSMGRGKRTRLFNKYQTQFLQENNADLGGAEEERQCKRTRADPAGMVNQELHQHTAVNVTQRTRVTISTSYFCTPSTEQPGQGNSSNPTQINGAAPAELAPYSEVSIDDQYSEYIEDVMPQEKAKREL
ncbi:hypothetical protein PAXINDRAFT_157002 [Paxillus involutus ATCC 200175]|uniref:Uncharacterized protein n=1 Tax=Paxillus involutus ATCC 200175 TaxID=664439 RepID=A0A0C9STM6_PAXIN|nr:hypothetical protein PAXINDRAFT_157002 [Paxillus involutus ATCC 200175]